MKKVNLNDIPWRERKSPGGKYHPDSNKWGFSLESMGTFRSREVNYYNREE